MRNFRVLAMVYAAFCIAVGVIWTLDLAVYLEALDLPVNAESAVFGHRVAPLMFGLGVMLYLARNEPPSPLRRIVCIAIALMFTGVAVTGLLTYAAGLAGQGILVAVAVETAAAALIVSVAQDR